MGRFWWTPGLVLFFFGVSSGPGAHGEGVLPVFVSIVPQKYFVDKIGGPRVKASIMVKPGASPATYEPRPRQMVALSKARLYFAIGVPFERVWLGKMTAANPGLLVVHTEAGIEKGPMETHRHGKGRAEGSGIKDPHIWLSPPLVKIVCRNIRDALVRVDPGHRAIYEANYRKFVLEIQELDAEIRQIFSAAGPGKEFMVFHPAWGYFARTYGLRQVAVELEGKEPRPADLKALIEHARERGIKMLLVQPEFSTKSAEAIAKAIGGQVVLASPLAADWAANLREVATKIRAALR